jgi:Skp family chaperone for outer membrane proteins
MAASKKSCFLLLFFLLILPAMIAAGGFIFAYLSYMRERALIVAEVERMPVFDRQKEAKQIASDFKFEYPAGKPQKELSELNKKVSSKSKKITLKKFSSREKSKKIFSIIKDFSMAKKGREITFQLKRRENEAAGKIIRGTFKGVINGTHGKFIHVNNEKYPLFSIIPEYHYLFLEHRSNALQESEIKKFRDSFDKNRKTYYLQVKDELENKYFKSAGYSRNEEGKWMANEKLLVSELEKRENDFNVRRDRKIRELIKKHKVFGFYEIRENEVKKLLSSDISSDSANNKTGK